MSIRFTDASGTTLRSTFDATIPAGSTSGLSTFYLWNDDAAPCTGVLTAEVRTPVYEQRTVPARGPLAWLARLVGIQMTDVATVEVARQWTRSDHALFAWLSTTPPLGAEITVPPRAGLPVATSVSPPVDSQQRAVEFRIVFESRSAR